MGGLGRVCRALVSGARCAALYANQEPPYDLALTGGRIVDGSGNSWFYGDVAVRGDQIARIAPA